MDQFPEQHTEHEGSLENTPLNDADKEIHLILPLILVGLMGVGVFVWFAGAPFSGMQKSTEYSGSNTEQQDLTQVSRRDATKIDPVRYERNREVLGLTQHSVVGRFFNVPGSRKTLYVTSRTNCADECLEQWKPYRASDELDEGDLTTVVREDDGTLQYAWKSQPLYTYKKEPYGGLLSGVGYEDEWDLARP